jgi:hypothetical protein
MKWKLRHLDTFAEETGEVKSRSTVLLEFLDATCTIADTGEPENHTLGSKKVLMDAAYRLEELAREMKNRADRIR